MLANPFETDFLPPLQVIDAPFLTEAQVRFSILRADLSHSALSGNKYYKLKYNLLAAKKQQYSTLLTFGGAYSNHLYATAAAGKLYGFQTIGIVRGEKHEPLNATLRFATDCGMKIVYMDREKYRQKTATSVINELKEHLGEFYLIPEGGSNELAVLGCQELGAIIKSYSPDYVGLAVGTGGTMAGIIKASDKNCQIIGFSSLKGGTFLENEIEKFLDAATIYPKWLINNDFHFGGYAKSNQELFNFINDFEQTYRIPLEPIYTGKMMYGFFELIKKGFFSPHTHLLAVHTGGLQGKQSLFK